MNQNNFLRKVYAGEFKLTDQTIEGLCYSDCDVAYGNSTSRIRFHDDGKKSEIVFKIAHSPLEDDVEMTSIVERHIPLKPRVSKEYFEDGIYDGSPMEFYHRFNTEKTEETLGRLEVGLKQVFELDYITQNPAQLVRTLRRDKKFLEEVIGKRIASREHDEIKKYVKQKRVFNFKTGLDNLIFARGKKIEIERRNGTEKSIFERAINDFADDNSYDVERPNVDAFGYRYADCESEEMPYLLTLDKKVEAGDVVELLKNMATYWRRPWEALPITSVDKVIRVEPAIPPFEEKTVLSSFNNEYAGLASKMIIALPKKRVRNILGKSLGRTLKEVKKGNRSVEVAYENHGLIYRQRVDISRNNGCMEFSVNTPNKEVAESTVIALSEILFNEINKPKGQKMKKEEALAVVRNRHSEKH